MMGGVDMGGGGILTLSGDRSLSLRKLYEEEIMGFLL
jgi:hypothetical protein